MTSLAVASRSFSKNPRLREKVFEKYPDAKFNDDGKILSGEELIDFLQGSSAAITALEKIDREILSKLPDLKIIGKYGVGLDMLDLQAMNEYNVKLGWEGGVNKRSVSELVLSSSISLLHRAVAANQEVRSGKWYQEIGRQLTNKVFGIIGCGHIGKDLVKLLAPFNCRILAHDILTFHDFYKKNNIEAVGLEDLLTNSDIISLHLPLDSSTNRILDSKKLSLIKRNAILINYARGGLIDEESLRKIIVEKKIGGVALDVLEVEPPLGDSFSNLDNVIVTPHIGGSSEEAIYAMGVSAIKALENGKDPLTFL